MKHNKLIALEKKTIAKLVILNKNNAPAKAGEIGRIAISGENVFKNYLYHNERDDFVSGLFLTGDLGYLSAQQELFITGREKEIINKGGEKIPPKEIDDVLLSHPCILEAITYPSPHPTLGEDIHCAIVLNQTIPLNEINEYLSENLPESYLPTKINIVNNIPKTPSGKIQRLKVNSLIESQQTKSPCKNLTPNEEIIVNIFIKELHTDHIDINQNIFSLGVDSLIAASIIQKINSKFNKIISYGFLLKNNTIKTLCKNLLEQEVKGNINIAYYDPHRILTTLTSINPDY
jgi:acyl carrier protein